MDKLAYFTDRKDQIAAFDQLWLDDAPWIIAFSGMSGNGKSTLIDWLVANKCKPQQIQTIKVDMSLAGGLNWDTVFSKLTALLLPAAAERFQAEAIASKQTYHRNLADLKKAEASRNIDLDMAPTAGGKIINSPMTVEADHNAEYTLTKIYQDSLLAAFYAELAVVSQNPVVLFFDTFERAQDNASEKELGIFWQFLETLHQTNPKLRIIVGGREDIDHPTARAWRTHSPLDQFSQLDSNLFLQRWSDDALPPELQEAIFKLAQGHPLLTELAAQLWRDGQLAGKPLTVAELGEGLTHRSGREWLYGRIINRLEALGDLRLSIAARYGPLLRSITMRSLNAILPDGVEALDNVAFEKFSRYAFMKQTDSGWAFHELMREAQRAYLTKQDDPTVDLCHQRAAKFYQDRAEVTQDPNMAHNALYHICFVDPAAAFEPWQSAAFQAQLAGERGWWEELLLTLEAPAQYRRLQVEQQGELTRNRGLWHVRNYTMDEALKSYSEALGLFRAVGDRLGEANTLKAIGDVQRFKDENDEALKSYSEALGLFRAVGDRLGEANTLQAIGFMKLDTGQDEEGLEQVNIALALYQQVGDRSGQANIYSGLGIWLAQNGHLTEAEPLIAEAVNLGNQFAAGHPFTLHMESTLTQIREMLKSEPK